MYSYAKLTAAIVYAAEAHKHQRRKADDSAYICHPLRVMNILSCGLTDDKEVLCAAVLHDVVEDTDVTISDVFDRFGEEVAEMVAEVTDDRSLSKAERKRAQVEKMKTASKGAQMIKLADKIDNCKDLIKQVPPGWTKERVQGYFVWCRAVVANMKDVLTALVDYFNDVCSLDVADGYPALPDGDHAEFLERYYASMQ